MKINLKISFSVLFGIVFFMLMMPLQFDRYVPVFHSVISIILCAASSLTFSFVLYKIINKSLLSKATGTILYFLVILGIAHGIYTAMFWSSLICLVIISIILIFAGIVFITNKIKNKEKS